VLGENLSRRIQDPLPGLGGPILLWLLAGPKPIRWGDGVLRWRMRVVNPGVTPQN
jgi:hypothetical protein